MAFKHFCKQDPGLFRISILDIEYCFVKDECCWGGGRGVLLLLKRLGRGGGGREEAPHGLLLKQTPIPKILGQIWEQGNYTLIKDTYCISLFLL
jgi:hypothetical protein